LTGITNTVAQDVNLAETTGRARAATSARLAFVAFVAAIGVALPLWLVLGRDQWFTFDEWDFLAGRSATELGDLLRPHGGHWSTLPILVYRALWARVGLRAYWPYQLVVVLMHLTVAVLLRVIMRRGGVSPWIATIAAALFAFFGAGYTNIIDGFQIGLVGSLVFGLTHLLLADHDGPLDRRDAMGLGAGFAGLLCSGVAVPMTIVVGITMLLRRGWRIALLHTAPLGVVYSLWAQRYPPGRSTFGKLTPRILTDFISLNLRTTFASLGQVRWVGVGLATMLVVGGGLTWAQARANREARLRAAAPAALLAGALLFVIITGFSRAGPLGGSRPQGDESRYIHVTAALAMPGLAVAASALVRRWRLLSPVVPAMLLIGIPGNIGALADHMDRAGPFNQGFKQGFFAIPRSPVAERVPRWVRPQPVLAPEVTIGWLRDAAASGRLPEPGPIAPEYADKIELTLSLVPPDKGTTTNRCRVIRDPATLTLRNGDSIAATGGDVYLYLRTARGVSRPLLLLASSTLVTVVDRLTIDVSPTGRGSTLCQ
jgi:hypothetical protein